MKLIVKYEANDYFCMFFYEINMRTIRLIITFYKLFFYAGLAISSACAYFVYIYKIDLFSEYFWLKTVTLGLFFYYLHYYKRDNIYYYYKNLGLSKKQLWIPTLIFDYILFLILSIIAIKN